MTSAAVLLAYEPEDVKPGWIALVLVLLLAVATFLLWINMNKQLRKINVPTRAELREAERAESAGPGSAGQTDVTDATPVDDDEGTNGQGSRSEF